MSCTTSFSRLHDKLRHIKLGKKDEDIWGT
jgi:hypothetical protein